MHVFAFIDTNVLLHFTFFNEVDWAAELSAGTVTLVFAPIILRELDQKKDSGGRKEKERARKVLKVLDELELSSTPTNLRSDTFVQAIGKEPLASTFAQHGLDPGINDDRLIAAAIEFRDLVGTHETVVVLTSDGGLKVKARTHRIALASPPESLKIPDAPDETEQALLAAQRELALARSAMPRLRVTCAGQTNLQTRVQLVTGWNRQAYSEIVQWWRSRHPRLSASPSSVEFPGIGNFDLTVLRGVGGFVSDEDAAARNAEIDRAFADFEAYAQGWPEALNRLRRTIGFSFWIENSGTAPARDVSILIRTDATGVWLTEAFVPERPPEPARRRSMFDFAEPRYFLDSRIEGLGRPVDSDVDGPNVTNDGRQLEFWVRRVKHNIPEKLDEAFFEFSANDAVGSFTIEYEIHAENMRKPESGKVHMKITLNEPRQPQWPWADESGESDVE